VKIFQQFLALLAVFSLVSQPVLADNLTSGYLLPDEISGAAGSEFKSGVKPGIVLMKVNLWGAVNKSGVHYIPTHTDLLTLLSYAGGPTASAETDEIVIRRRGRGREEVIEVDVDELIQNVGTKNPVLEANDIVIVPKSRPVVSDQSMRMLTVVLSVFSIVLTSLVISDRLEEGK